MRMIATIVLLSLTASCATMSPEQCASADWGAVGQSDGASGEALTKAEKRGSACAKGGVTLDREAYLSGRERGLAQYCTPYNAFEIGKVYGRYDGVCTNHDETAFLAAYEQGQALAGMRTSAADAERKVGEAAVEIAQITETIDGYSSGAIAFEAENHNEKVLHLWSRRKYLLTEVIPYWKREQSRVARLLDRYDQRGVYGGFDPDEVAAASAKGPRPYAGPTEQDAREMVADVFAGVAAKARAQANQ